MALKRENIWILRNEKSGELKLFFSRESAVGSVLESLIKSEVSPNVWNIGKGKYKLWLQKIEDSSGLKV